MVLEFSLPADVSNTVEVVCNLGNGRRDDGLIQSYEKDRQAERPQDDPKFDTMRILHVFLVISGSLFLFCCDIIDNGISNVSDCLVLV